MSFIIQFDKNTEKFLDSLQKDIALRIIEKIEKVGENPFYYLEHYE